MSLNAGASRRLISNTHSDAAPVLRPVAFAVAFAFVAGAAVAQTQPANPDTQQPTQVQRVEITGSSIKRLEGETALPVQIITKADIEKSGATTAAELLTKVSASAAQLTDGASFSDIAGQRGFNGANLRGIGVSSTLVLLNGRRLANFASPGGNSGVDLNAIPAAAIERVDVLKDGASAIYGTDAIGGVINFITRRDYQGGDFSLYRFDTQHGGAAKTIATGSIGFGDIAKDRYNVFATLDYQDSEALRSTQRDWIGSVYDEALGLDVGSSNTFPANVRRLNSAGRPTGSRLNPSAPNCNPPATIYSPGSFVGSSACLYDYMQDTEIYPASKRLSLITRGTFAVTDEHQVFAEYLYSDTKTNYRISPLTITDLNYPAAGRYYPTSLGVTGPLRVNMRLSEAGGRTNDVDANAQRLIVGAKGVLAGWDYDTAINRSENTVTDAYVNGYVRRTDFNNAFATGNINPFGPSDAAGLALLNSTKIRDDARKSKGVTDSFDVKLSRPIFQLAGGEAAIALGAEYRRESLDFTPSALLAAGEIRGDGPATPLSASRKITAGYAELSLPFTKQLEAQVALRGDRYNDVGNTTNPKLGLRYSPTKQFLLRTSYGTGFRAPSLSDLYAPPRLGQTNGIYDDPLGCAAARGTAFAADYCGLQPDKLTGGNKNLKPEESKQFSAGFVFEPARVMTMSVDYWRIEKTNVISAPEGVLFSDPVRFSQFIIRDTAPSPIPGIPSPIVSVDSSLKNFAALKTDGWDLGVDVRLPRSDYGRVSLGFNGTYVNNYKTQEGAGARYITAVGRFANDQVVQRWRHTATVNYDFGDLGLTLQQTYYSNYYDQNLDGAGRVRKIGAYELFDLAGSYQVSKQLKVRAGIKNLLDKNPPRSNQVYYFLASYDPSYTDPRGRSFYASVAYSFR
ncbi:TonB-dependent receptor [Piscinibacterium candidicorallinum]|uniref:TonB-dependent receptor n=1 Tax=Piscinibacterium candidicorallinum TaxID=1793872 RepID=A0ABV7H0F8_9BURK